ncbi:uncharacterized protein LOC144883252 [Branchiostoma floridae x Branchiostoma japonicum]
MWEQDSSSNSASLSSKPQDIVQPQKNGVSDNTPQENASPKRTTFPPITIVQRKEVVTNSPLLSSSPRLRDIVPVENNSPSRRTSVPIVIVQRKEVPSKGPVSSPRQKETSPRKDNFSKSAAASSPRAIAQRKNVASNSPSASPRQREIVERKNSLSNSPASTPRQKTIAQQKNALSDSPLASPRQTNRTASSPRAIVQQKEVLSNSPASSPRQKAIVQQKNLSDSPLASPRPSNKTASSPRAIVQRKEPLSNSPASSPRQQEIAQQKNASSYRTGSSPRAVVQQKVLTDSPASSPRQREIAQRKNVLSDSPASSPRQGGYFPELREGYKEAAGIIKNLEDMADSQELSRKDSGFSSVSSAELLRDEEEAALKAKELEKTEENLKELGKLAKLFDKQGLEFTDAQPKKVEAPSQEEVPLLDQLKMQREKEKVLRMEDGAMPITLETALALRKLLFGTGNYTFNIEWKRTRFTFKEVKSNFPYGLFMEKHGSRGMTMCVQAYILKHLLYRDGCLLEEKGNSNNLLVERFNMGFFEDQRADALLHALADILWKAGEGKYAAVTIVGEKMCLTPNPELRFDGYTEKILIYEFTDFEALLKFLRRNLDQFQGDFSPGGILMVYSAMLSRTFPKLIQDMDEHKTPTMLTPAEGCTTALVNLFLTGRAVSYLFNGKVVYDKKRKPLAYPLIGQKERAELGFLFWDKTEFEVQDKTEVGSMLKTPKLPIWLTSVNDVYGILFCTVPDLLSHWRKEHRFSLFYFTGQASQIQGTKLTIDNRSGRNDTEGDDEEQKIPSLERCILTKWPDAVVNWNGTSPFV